MLPPIFIFGSSLAALAAAIECAQKKISVVLCAPHSLAQSAGALIKGGMNVALHPEDSPQAHFEDTIRAGDYLANQQPVFSLCKAAPEIVNWLCRAGACFKSSEERFPVSSLSEGSRFPRTLLAGLKTGHEILRVLDGQVRRFEAQGLIGRLEGWNFLAVVQDEQGRAAGAVLMNRVTMEVKAFQSFGVIICSSQLTVALPQVYEQGAYLANVEFGGGLWVDEHHQTNLNGVFAAGEAVNAYHGAHALEGNQILAALFGGKKAAQKAMEWIHGFARTKKNGTPLLETETRRQHAKTREVLGTTGGENIYLLMEELEKTMAPVLGCKSGEWLKKTDVKILELIERAQRVSLSDRGLWCNQGLMDALSFQGKLELARAILAAALCRNESRGDHQKTEYPNRDDRAYLKTTKVRLTSSGPNVAYEDVEMGLEKPMRLKGQEGKPERIRALS